MTREWVVDARAWCVYLWGTYRPRFTFQMAAWNVAFLVAEAVSAPEDALRLNGILLGIDVVSVIWIIWQRRYRPSSRITRAFVAAIERAARAFEGARIARSATDAIEIAAISPFGQRLDIGDAANYPDGNHWRFEQAGILGKRLTVRDHRIVGVVDVFTDPATGDVVWATRRS